MWDGEEGFDFLGLHHRQVKSVNSRGKTYHPVRQWLTKKAEQHIRDVIKERLAPPRARVQSLESHVEYLNPKILGWKNYYATPYYTSKLKMEKLDWYIKQRFAHWYAKKTQNESKQRVFQKLDGMLKNQGLLKLATRTHMNDGHRKAV